MEVRKKRYIDKNVYEKSLERIEQMYREFDTIVVSFSGGKDSTTVLNCTVDVARKLGKLPVKAVFFDEEAINNETIDYARRVYQREDIEMYWYCVNIKHRNACSNKQPFWWSWDKEKQDIWVRPLPPEGITHIKGFDGKKLVGTKTGIGAPIKHIFTEVSKYGKVCFLSGVRAQESMTRYKAVATNKNDNFYSKDDGPNHFLAHPIYDWSSEDVWVGVSMFGWDYNKTYDIYNLVGALNGKLLKQRVCAPFGEEPLRGFQFYKECFPSYWAKLTRRVKGVGSALRYANTHLYSVKMTSPPEGMNWRDFIEMVLENYEKKEYDYLVKHINMLVRRHYKQSILDIQEDKPDPVSGCSWKFLAKVALKGDFKGRTQYLMSNQKSGLLQKLGLTFEQALEKWGTEDYKKSRENRKK